MRVRALVFPLMLLFIAIAPGGAAADTLISQERAPSKVSAELNRVVWSSYDPATGDYSLMSRIVTGEVTRLPVAPRKVPFDVDLGYLGEGAEVAAYSRCKQEPSITGGGSNGLLPDYATGRGCNIYLFDFDAQTETKYAPTAGGNASEFLPSVSAASRVAFARVYEHRSGSRSRLPYLYAKRGLHTPRQLPGGARGTTGLPGPTSLDLFGPRLAFSWDYQPRSRGIHASDIRVDVVRGPHRTLQSVRGGLVARTLMSPSIVLKEMLWGRTLAAGNGGRSDLLYDANSLPGGTRNVQAPNFLASTSGVPSRGGIYYLTTQSPTATGPAGSVPACGAPAEAFPPTCTVARTDPLTFGP
jgi:hypothetical protein